MVGIGIVVGGCGVGIVVGGSGVYVDNAVTSLFSLFLLSSLITFCCSTVLNFAFTVVVDFGVEGR